MGLRVKGGILRDKNGFLADVEELLNQTLGHPRGTLALRAVCEKWGGETCYIPSQTELFLAVRNEEIRLRFRGDNYGELALIYKITERQVRRIVNGQ